MILLFLAERAQRFNVPCFRASRVYWLSWISLNGIALCSQAITHIPKSFFFLLCLIDPLYIYFICLWMQSSSDFCFMVHREPQFHVSLENPTNRWELTFSRTGSPSDCPFVWHLLLSFSEKKSWSCKVSGEQQFWWPSKSLSLSLIFCQAFSFSPSAMYCLEIT